VVSLFTNIPVDEASHVIQGRFLTDHTLAERSTLHVKAIMELLEICLRTTYFQVNDKFFQQKDGKAMGSALSLVVSNIFMQHFEELALETVDQNHRCGSGMWMVRS
jgi:hypothetical protein